MKLAYNIAFKEWWRECLIILFLSYDIRLTNNDFMKLYLNECLAYANKMANNTLSNKFKGIGLYIIFK